MSLSPVKKPLSRYASHRSADLDGSPGSPTARRMSLGSLLHGGGGGSVGLQDDDVHGEGGLLLAATRSKKASQQARQSRKQQRQKEKQDERSLDSSAISFLVEPSNQTGAVAVLVDDEQDDQGQ